MTSDEAEKPWTSCELLEALANERKYLDRRGYCFPAMFAAIEFLLKQQDAAPSSDDEAAA